MNIPDLTAEAVVRLANLAHTTAVDAEAGKCDLDTALCLTWVAMMALKQSRSTGGVKEPITLSANVGGLTGDER